MVGDTYMEDNTHFRNIAKVCHAANKAFCEVNGDFSHLDWEDLSEDAKDTYVQAVRWQWKMGLSPEEQHDFWVKSKLQDGWIWGKVKDVEKKIHPSLIPWSELPLDEKFKDHLFVNIVKALG